MNRLEKILSEVYNTSVGIIDCETKKLDETEDVPLVADLLEGFAYDIRINSEGTGIYLFDLNDKEDEGIELGTSKIEILTSLNQDYGDIFNGYENGERSEGWYSDFLFYA